MVGLGDVGQGRIKVEGTRIGAKRDGKRAHAAIGMHQAIQQRAFVAGGVIGLRYRHQRARQDFDQARVAPRLGGAGFDVGVIGARIGNRPAGGEDHLSHLGRELPARIRSPRLHDHRPALHRARNVQRPGDGKIFALVIKLMHPRGIPEDAAFLVSDKGIFREAIPKPGHHIMEFARAGIAFGVVHMFRHAEIARRIGVGGGDDIPPRAAAADVIQ